ncbi:MAG: hypothetical protein KDA25_02200 [Phycisphaerales bacterium]|nr:hypothetical protein [Phycisphaerales bacterium]
MDQDRNQLVAKGLIAIAVSSLAVALLVSTGIAHVLSATIVLAASDSYVEVRESGAFLEVDDVASGSVAVGVSHRVNGTVWGICLLVSTFLTIQAIASLMLARVAIKRNRQAGRELGAAGTSTQQ